MTETPNPSSAESYEQGRDDESNLQNASLYEATQSMLGSYDDEQARAVIEEFARRVKQCVGRNRRPSERSGAPRPVCGQCGVPLPQTDGGAALVAHGYHAGWETNRG